MFIGRRPNGSIYGAWTCQQPQDADHSGMEEVTDDHPDLVAFLAPRPPVAPKDLLDEFNAMSPARKALYKAELAKP